MSLYVSLLQDFFACFTIITYKFEIGKQQKVIKDDAKHGFYVTQILIKGRPKGVTPKYSLKPLVGRLSHRASWSRGSLVRPKVVKSVHYFPSTKQFTSREYPNITSNVGTGSVYPTRDDNGNLLVTEYGLCHYKDHQTLSMQKVPKNSAPGQLPRTVDVIVENDP